MSDRPDLAALIGSRICHDLISPIGAIGNGVELLQMGPAGKTPELALIADSVAHASARLRFFRIAYGAGAGEIGRTEIEAILADMARGGRVSLSLAAPVALPRREVKLAFLAVQCLESALPFGGQVTLDRDGQGWTLVGRSPRLTVDPKLWGLLASPAPAPDIDPGHVHFALLCSEAQAQERRLTVDLGTEAIVIGF